MATGSGPGGPPTHESAPGPEPAAPAGVAAMPDEGGADQQAEPAAVEPRFSVMEVASVHVDLPSPFPLVTLTEVEEPFRVISMPIGMAEGVALAHALHKVPTPRPLTHELFDTVLRRLHVDLVAVRIVGRTAGTYLAELDLMATGGREVVPCRPSDGLVLALRCSVPAPVLADVRLLEGPGDVLT